MKIAVPQFPGSNCDQDAIFALRNELNLDAQFVWHEESSLADYDGVFVPGGFTYGDYLRVGAIASRSPIMQAVKRFAEEGKPVIGVCNGFQILCETGMLPGALLPNIGQKFLCQDVFLHAENRTSAWTRNCDTILRIPIAHNEGRYICEPETIQQLKSQNRIAFTYCGPQFETNESYNPNGSEERIAGILNEQGNVLGMMPHPERACSDLLGCEDGLKILTGFRELAKVAVTPAAHATATA